MLEQDAAIMQMNFDKLEIKNEQAGNHQLIKVIIGNKASNVEIRKVVGQHSIHASLRGIHEISKHEGHIQREVKHKPIRKEKLQRTF